jgi:type II secretory pathway pseudopilin PulG
MNASGSIHFVFVSHAAKRAQRGYALLMVVVLGALMLVAVTAAAPNILTQGRREKEEEMIWRGEQYARAVRLFYRKNGRFPTSIDDLVEKRTNIRYLRQRYTDPMNREDGSWRLIYVGPGGQLIGSVTRTGGLQFPAQTGGLAPGKAPGASGATGATPLQPVPFGPRPSAQPAPLGGSGTALGGNIIGVASKIEQTSLKVYNERSIYKEWEFIWDPAKEMQVPGATPFGVPQTQPGVRPPGTPPQPRQ